MSRNPHLYSAIMRKINADPWFLGLKPMEQWLWFRLLTGRHVTTVPGLWNASEGSLAADLHIGKRKLRTLLKGLCEVPYSDGTRRVYLDSGHGVLWVPKNISQPCNQPDNEFVVRGWISHIEMVTDCDLKDIALGEFRAWIESHPRRFPNGIPEDFPTPTEEIGRDRLPRPSTETVCRDRLPRPSAETVSTEGQKPLDAYARARENGPSEPSQPSPSDLETDRNLDRVESVSTRNGSKLGSDGVNSEEKRIVPNDSKSTTQPNLALPFGRTSETVSQTVYPPVSPQDQDQDQDLKPVSKEPVSLPASRTDPAEKQTDKPISGPALTPTERCERSFNTQLSPEALALWETYKGELGREKATLDLPRREFFEALAFEGVTVEIVTLVCRGAKRDKWATEVAHLDEHAILGKASQREKFIRFEQSAAAEDKRIKNRYAPAPPERVIAPENRVSPEELERGLAEVERVTRGSVRSARRPEPIALIPTVPEQSEADRSAAQARRASEARIALAALDAEESHDELPPALEA